jgi:cyclic lactone autoinducer peptide
MKVYKNKKVLGLLTVSASILSLIAVVSVNAASVFFIYQGKTPKELLK